MTDKSIIKERKRFTLRMNLILFERVKELAAQNKRSISKEIEFILNKYVL